MMNLEVDLACEYESTGDGILVPVRIVLSGKSVELTARLDTGAAHGLSHRSYADLLDIRWDAGVPQSYRTVVGSFRAYGHELTLHTWDFHWSAMVYFHESGSPNSNYLGKTGWLDRVRLGLVHHDQRILIARY